MAKPISRQKTAQIYFALGHPRRLRIIETLLTRPKGLTFEEMELFTRIPHASLCHHVRFLKDAGLLTRNVVGRFSIYKLDQELLTRMVGEKPSLPRISKAA